MPTLLLGTFQVDEMLPKLGALLRKLLNHLKLKPATVLFYTHRRKGTSYAVASQHCQRSNLGGVHTVAS